MSFGLSLLVVALAGFVALGNEIVWFRVYAFVTGGTTASFGVLLAAYLAGIAFGSLAARAACRDATATGERSRLLLPAWLTVAASALGFAVAPVVAWYVTHWHWATTLPLVALVAGLNGALLPLIAHFGVPPDHRAGERLSWLYLANIVGSTAGSLTTGFVLLDHLPLRHVAAVLTAVGLGMAALLFAVAAGGARRAVLPLVGCVVLAAATVPAAPWAFDGLWEKLQRKTAYDGEERFRTVIEGRSGVITVSQEGAVFGGGVYDGGFNVGLVPDTNVVVRAYAVAGLHPAPKRMLMVGLSSGSWATVLADAPGLERLDIVEINPDYVRLIENEPLVAPLLRNPKVHVHIDDGRRWMEAHPDEKFDVIVQNTTWYWRGHSANLLSEEYMRLGQAHLRPGGVLLFNTTWFRPAMVTPCRVFRSGLRILNFMYVSDRERLELDLPRWREALTRWTIQGEKVLDLSQESHRAALDAALALPTQPAFYERCSEILERSARISSITDDNMLPEFDYPWHFTHLHDERAHARRQTEAAGLK